MASENQTIMTTMFCSDCGIELRGFNTQGTENERSPCSECGGIARLFKVNIEDGVSVNDDLYMKGFGIKPTGGKKLNFKGKFGAELHKDSNTLQERERSFDFIKDEYYEKIINKELGFFKEVHDKATNHTGHGSAKKKNKN